MALTAADINGANINPEVKKLFFALIGAQAGGDSGSASPTGLGTVKQAANVAASTDVTNVAVQFNALRNALIASGVLVGP